MAILRVRVAVVAEADEQAACHRLPHASGARLAREFARPDGS
jgi:hypothetical protein